MGGVCGRQAAGGVWSGRQLLCAVQGTTLLPDTMWGPQGRLPVGPVADASARCHAHPQSRHAVLSSQGCWAFAGGASPTRGPGAPPGRRLQTEVRRGARQGRKGWRANR